MYRVSQPTKGATREERDKLHAAYQKELLRTISLVDRVQSLRAMQSLIAAAGAAAGSLVASAVWWLL